MPNNSLKESAYTVVVFDDTESGVERIMRLTKGSSIDIKGYGKYWNNIEALKIKLAQNEIQPSAFVTDLFFLRNPNEGLNLIRNLRKEYPNVPIIAWTKFAQENSKKALYAGADKCIWKYFEDSNIKDVIIDLIESRRGNEVR
jgi:CheY-like chemotaxis protein